MEIAPNPMPPELQEGLGPAHVHEESSRLPQLFPLPTASLWRVMAGNEFL